MMPADCRPMENSHHRIPLRRSEPRRRRLAPESLVLESACGLALHRSPLAVMGPWILGISRLFFLAGSFQVRRSRLCPSHPARRGDGLLESLHFKRCQHIYCYQEVKVPVFLLMAVGQLEEITTRTLFIDAYADCHARVKITVAAPSALLLSLDDRRAFHSERMICAIVGVLYI